MGSCFEDFIAYNLMVKSVLYFDSRFSSYYFFKQKSIFACMHHRETHGGGLAWLVHDWLTRLNCVGSGWSSILDGPSSVGGPG